MATIAPFGKYRAFDDNGDPLSGGLLYTYEAGTSTPKDTFTTQAGDVANANPVVLDSDGYADVWLGDGAYKFTLRDSGGNLIFTVDNIGGTSDTAFGGTVYELSSNTTINSTYQNAAIFVTGTTTLTLLPAADAGEGFYISVKNTGSSTVTIDPDASETIDGASSLVLKEGHSAIIICTGTAWFSMCLVDVTLAGDNIFTGDNTFQGIVDVTHVNAETSAGGDLRTNGGTACISWGGGGAANSTLGGDMSGASTYKLVNMIDPTSAQDYATKNYVDTYVIKQSATQTPTSGTTVNFGSIPANTRQIVISLAGISTTGTENLELTLGDAGGIETTGYLGAISRVAAASASSDQFPTDAFTLAIGMAAGATLHGSVILTLVDAATFAWAVSGSLGRGDTTSTYNLGGSKALSAALTQVQLQTAGTNTFDAGIVSIQYFVGQ